MGRLELLEGVESYLRERVDNSSNDAIETQSAEEYVYSNQDETNSIFTSNVNMLDDVLLHFVTRAITDYLHKSNTGFSEAEKNLINASKSNIAAQYLQIHPELKDQIYSVIHQRATAYLENVQKQDLVNQLLEREKVSLNHLSALKILLEINFQDAIEDPWVKEIVDKYRLAASNDSESVIDIIFKAYQQIGDKSIQRTKLDSIAKYWEEQASSAGSFTGRFIQNIKAGELLNDSNNANLEFLMLWGDLLDNGATDNDKEEILLPINDIIAQHVNSNKLAEVRQKIALVLAEDENQIAEADLLAHRRKQARIPVFEESDADVMKAIPFSKIKATESEIENEDDEEKLILDKDVYLDEHDSGVSMTSSDEERLEVFSEQEDNLTDNIEDSESDEMYSELRIISVATINEPSLAEEIEAAETVLPNELTEPLDNKTSEGAQPDKDINFEQVARWLKETFKDTNSSGIKKMKHLANQLLQDTRLQDDEKLSSLSSSFHKMALERNKGLQHWWSTSHFFGKGRSSLAQAMYDVAKNEQFSFKNVDVIQFMEQHDPHGVLTPGATHSPNR